MKLTGTLIIFLVTVRNHGLLQESLYDVTEYEESFSEDTPLIHLTTLDTQCLGKPTTKQFFENEMIQNWISSKIKANISALLTTFFLRIFFLIIFVVFSARMTNFEERAYLKDTNIYGNYTNASVNASLMSQGFVTKNRLTSCLMEDYSSSIFDYACAIFISFWCLLDTLGCTKYMAEWLKYSPMLHYPHRRKNLIIGQNYVYVINELNISILATTFTVSKILRSKFNTSLPYFIDDFTYFNVLLSSCVQIVLLCQVLPKVGSFPIILFRLFGDLYSFIMILVLFMTPFIMTIQYTINRGQKQCIFGFTNYFDTFYSMFLAMNNMLDIEKLAKGLDTRGSTVTLYVLHYFYVFFVNILMLNFLIALFSHSVARTMEHKDIVVALNNLNMYPLEKALTGILGWWFKIVKRKCFTYRNGKLFVTSVKMQAP